MGRAPSRLVRVQVRGALPQAHHRQRVSHHLFAVERPEHLSAGKRRHHEHRHRLDLQVSLTPNFALQLNAPLKFLERATLANDDVLACSRRPRSLRLSFRFPVHRFPAASRVAGFLPPRAFSPRFVSFHSLFLSARRTSANACPLSDDRRSISRNPRAKLAFALFSATFPSSSQKR